MGLTKYLVAAVRGRALARDLRGRFVVFLEAEGGDILGACHRAAAANRWLSIMSIGYPQSRAQQVSILCALETAPDLGVPVEASLFASMRQARRSLSWNDVVLPLEVPQPVGECA